MNVVFKTSKGLRQWRCTYASVSHSVNTYITEGVKGVFLAFRKIIVVPLDVKSEILCKGKISF